MPQRVSQKVTTSFNKGLLTEFSELNFPENASIDELNCSLFKAGNRSRRLGLSLEAGAVLTDETYNEGTVISTHTWSNVNDEESLEYLVVQTGGSLRFFRKGTVPLSDGVVTDSGGSTVILDMSSFNRLGGLGAEASRIDVTSIDGYLVVVSPEIEPFYVKKDDNGDFTTTAIDFRVRDFSWLGNREDYFEPEPVAGVTDKRKYDTYNAGWKDGLGVDSSAVNADTALDTYIKQEAAWPPLTHPWYIGKGVKPSSGKTTWTVREWQAVAAGNSLTANGSFVVNLFNKRRASTSELLSLTDDLPEEVIEKRFTTCQAYAGRVWYGGANSKIYFSQILETIDYIGDCYQVNDPTSENSSDLLPTDGGYVRIPEAKNIRKLHTFGASLLVFAENGVWRISGVDGNIFDPTDFSVYKVTDFGLAFRASFIGSQNAAPFWWSYQGIHTIEVSEGGGFKEVNISRDTVQTFFENINPEKKAEVISTYDAFNNSILWLYPNNNETIEGKFNNILFLDIDLGAFYPWKVSDQALSTNYIVGTSFFGGKGSQEVDYTVVNGAGDTVQDGSGNDVIVSRTVGNILSSSVDMLIRDGATGKLTFAQFSSADFLDWGDTDYTSYAESAYNFMGDLGRRKNAPFFTVFMKETETGFELNGATYDPVRPSSLKISAYWDFRKLATTSAQELYRHKQPIVVDPANLTDFGSPTTVLTTRFKLRGRGRVVRLRFESSQGKDFNLLGWETVQAINSGY